MKTVGGAPPDQLDRTYKYMRLEWNAEFSMLTTRIGVKPIQCYSLAAMAELHQVFNDISANPGLVKHFVMASDVPNVFNFGGDLSLFVLLVRARDLIHSSCMRDAASIWCGGSKMRPRLVCIRRHSSREIRSEAASNPPFFTTT